jgi:hypothetical protein
MTLPPILVSVSSNEVARPRFQKIQAAIEADERFAFAPMGGYQEPLFDLKFTLAEEWIGDDPYVDFLDFHVELKDFSEDANSDYLSSILSGHLYEQVLAGRERGESFAIVVLGDDNDVGAAIRKAASRPHGKMDPEKLMEYFQMVEGFEANCIGMNIPVWRLKTDPYKRMLLRVRKILQGGDLTGFAPTPAKGERAAVGLSILAGKGIGPTKARAILEKFRVSLVPRHNDNYLMDCAGIGEKLAMQIFHSKTLSVDSGNVCRPPKPRKRKAMLMGATAV